MTEKNKFGDIIDSAFLKAGMDTALAIKAGIDKDLALFIQTVSEIARQSQAIIACFPITNYSRLGELREKIRFLHDFISDDESKKKLIEYILDTVHKVKEEEDWLKKIMPWSKEEIKADRDAMDIMLKQMDKELSNMTSRLSTLYKTISDGEDDDIESAPQAQQYYIKWGKEYEELRRLSEGIKKALMELMNIATVNVARVKSMTDSILSNEMVYGYTKEQEDIMREMLITELTVMREKADSGSKKIEEIRLDAGEYKSLSRYYEKEKGELRKSLIQGLIPAAEKIDTQANHYLYGENLTNYLNDGRAPQLIVWCITNKKIPLEVHKCDDMVCIGELEKRGFGRFYKFNMWHGQDRTYIIAFARSGEMLIALTNINGNDLLLHCEASLKFAGVDARAIKTILYFKKHKDYYSKEYPKGIYALGLGMARSQEVISDRIRKTALFERIQQFIFNFNQELISQVNVLTDHGGFFNLRDKIGTMLNFPHCPKCNCRIDVKFCPRCGSAAENIIQPLVHLFEKNPIYQFLMCCHPSKIFKYNSYVYLFNQEFLSDWDAIATVYFKRGFYLPRNSSKARREKINDVLGFKCENVMNNELKPAKMSIIADGKKRDFLLMGYPYGDLSESISGAFISKGVKHIFFCGTFGGFPKQLTGDRKLAKGDLVAPDNIFLDIAGHETEVHNEIMDGELFGNDAHNTLGAHDGNDPIEKDYRNKILKGVYITNHVKLPSMHVETLDLITGLMDKHYESVEVETYCIAKAIADSGGKAHLACVLNCSDVLFEDVIKSDGNYDEAITVRIKNRMIDYFLEYFKIGYTEDMRKRILEINKDILKEEKVIEK